MRRRSEKLARRRERLPADALIGGVDLAKKEAIVVYVRASDRARVGKLRVSSDPEGRAHLIARGRELAAEQGTGPLVIAMEPTSHFWKPLARAAQAADVDYVLVQGFVVAHARELDAIHLAAADETIVERSVSTVPVIAPMRVRYSKGAQVSPDSTHPETRTRDGTVGRHLYSPRRNA